MVPDDVLEHAMMPLVLFRLVQLKLINHQWRRVARRVLTSNEWLYTEYSGRDFLERDLFSETRLSGNLLSMQQAVTFQWNAIQLPCRIQFLFTGEAEKRGFENGILEDLIVDRNLRDRNLRIRSLVVSYRDMRFFAPHHVEAEFDPGNPLEDEHDLFEWILEGIFPMLPDSTRSWLHPRHATLKHHLEDKTRPFRRSSGGDVRVFA